MLRLRMRRQQARLGLESDLLLSNTTEVTNVVCDRFDGNVPAALPEVGGGVIPDPGYWHQLVGWLEKVLRLPLRNVLVIY